ncbi:MAG: hypothetical protein J5785_00780 [Spirochaetales bacterium]|nr:hypothetical protein [Spirochaetales bacterium]
MDRKVIRRFSIFEGNDQSGMTSIDIVGKTVTAIRIYGGSQLKKKLPDDPLVQVGGGICVCFGDGNELELSAYDETFFAAYNASSWDGEQPDPQKGRVYRILEKEVIGHTVTSSDFCGREVSGTPMSLRMVLDNAVCLSFTAPFGDDTLNLAINRG